MDDAPRVRTPNLLPSIAVAAAALFLIATTHPDAAAAKGKKLHACVVKSGPDKGVMSFSRTGTCHKGEKKLSWNKKGKRGKAGTAGATGATGPQGPSGVTQQLLDTIASQQTQIDQLTSQLNTVTSQLSALTPTVAALCGQMTTVTSQSDALRSVIAGLNVTLGVLNIPTLPTALGAFSCP